MDLGSAQSTEATVDPQIDLGNEDEINIINTPQNTYVFCGVFGYIMC